jgi:hypothetical protein
MVSARRQRTLTNEPSALPVKPPGVFKLVNCGVHQDPTVSINMTTITSLSSTARTSKPTQAQVAATYKSKLMDMVSKKCLAPGCSHVFSTTKKSTLDVHYERTHLFLFNKLTERNHDVAGGTNSTAGGSHPKQATLSDMFKRMDDVNSSTVMVLQYTSITNRTVYLEFVFTFAFCAYFFVFIRENGNKAPHCNFVRKVLS